MRRTLVALLSVLCAGGGMGCAAPTLTRDGQLVFSEGGARGASVITANGVEFLDRNDVPRPVVRRSANEPWRPATGFLLPADGVWRETSTPVPVEGHGLVVVLRSSDSLVPSWGGEILLRMDAIVPAAAFPDAARSLRAPERLAIVIDGHDANTAPLVEVALDNLGERDRVCLVDSARAHTVMPLVPGTHRTLLRATTERAVAARATVSRDLPAALAIARGWIGARGGKADPQASRHVLVISDGVGISEAGSRVAREVGALRGAGARIVAIGSDDRLEPAALSALGDDVHAGGRFRDREQAVDDAVPPPGDIALKDVSLHISSAPAPARIIELSGGTSSLALEEDQAYLGDLYTGEARTEVARIALPVWVPGEPLRLTVTATYSDAAGQPLTAKATLPCRYSSDVAEIAESRHGDVIAYASALAMVRRLDRAFAGSQVDRLGGLRPVVAWQARSLDALARSTHDPALGAQAEILTTLLDAIRD